MTHAGSVSPSLKWVQEARPHHVLWERFTKQPVCVTGALDLTLSDSLGLLLQDTLVHPTVPMLCLQISPTGGGWEPSRAWASEAALAARRLSPSGERWLGPSGESPPSSLERPLSPQGPLDSHRGSRERLGLGKGGLRAPLLLCLHPRVSNLTPSPCENPGPGPTPKPPIQCLGGA